MRQHRTPANSRASALRSYAPDGGEGRPRPCGSGPVLSFPRLVLMLPGLCLFALGASGLTNAQAAASQAAIIAPPAAAKAAPDSQSARDPFLSPPPGSVPDSAGAPPMQEVVNLSPRGAFSVQTSRVGDSLDYVITVAWEETQVPVVVLAPDSVDFPGFKILGQSTQHKKMANGQSIRNQTEFIYSLRAATQGTGKAASLKVRYLTGLSQREEAVFVPSALIDIGPAPVHLMDMLWFKLLLWLVILGGAGTIGWASFKMASRKRSQAAPKPADLRPQVEALKTRLRTAQNNPEASKAIIMEMEALAIRFLQDETGEEKQPRFETLADAYLSKGRDSEAADWAKLMELFRHARFAGGYKEPHELQDAFRTFRKCLKMQAEDGL